MKQEAKHSATFATKSTLVEDFALIGEAIADAFRGMSSSSRLESRWSRMRSCPNC
jgi:hypothetical protein